MRHRSATFSAIGDLTSRYAEILASAWKNRRTIDASRRLAHEIAFLPANLELIEAPPHPAPRWLARILLSVMLCVVLVAAFGKLDIVAIAPGQLIPNASVKIIQPAVTGIVRHILVQNGERVVAEQLLIELDPTQATADADKAMILNADARLDLARARALLSAQENSAEPLVAPVEGASLARQVDIQGLATDAFREYRYRLSSQQAELRKREAELQTLREEMEKLQQTLPFAQQQAADYRDLAKDRYVASHDYLDKQRAAIEQTHELAAEQSKEKELREGIEQQRRDIDVDVATFRRQQWELLNKADEDIAQTDHDKVKANARQDLMRIKSPVAGVVQQLNVHTVGGVVTSAQPLMEIVPDDALEVEAHVSNKDIGFVIPGQKATVKISTFPFTRYGYLTGMVIKVSTDSTMDKSRGLVFPARIRIPGNQFRIEDKWLSLSPGMEVTAEIKTGQQKVWQYFFGPLISVGQEGLRER